MENENKQTELKEFKELLLRLEHLRKEEIRYWHKYIQEFSHLIEENFSLKIESIKLKKSLAFCQAKVNRGQPIEQADLESHIEKGMEKYYQELDSIIRVREDKGKPITMIDHSKIKKLYYKIVNSIHPDLHPNLFQDERIQELWDKACSAYRCNNLAELDNIEVLLATTLQELGIDTKINVDNLAGKIARTRVEITQIVQNEPYMYKYLLEDDSAIEQKQQELMAEIEEYREYVASLKEELAHFKIEIGRLS